MLGLQRAGRLAHLLITITLLTACGLAHASCIEAPDPAIRRLQALAISDPNTALSKAQVMLDAAVAAHAAPQDIAWLYSVRAEAYSALELDADARQTTAE